MPSSSSLRPRSFVIAAALAVALVARESAAQAPPDLPPLQPPPAQPAPAAQPAPPAQPTPRMAPPGFTWTSPASVPPGYPMPAGYYPVYPSAPRPADYALPPPPPRRRKSMGMWVGGVLMVSGGIGAAIAGAALVSSATDRIDIYCDSPSFPCAHRDDGGLKAGGIILMAAGAAIGAAGIPLWLIGSKYVPLSAQPNPAPPRPAWVPDVRIGAGSASVTMRF